MHHLGTNQLIWFFHCRCLSISRPRNFVFTDFSTYIFYNQYLKVCCGFFIINFIIFVLSRFRANLLAETHYSSATELFDILLKSSYFLLEILTQALLANIMSSDKVFTVGVRSFMYIMKSKGPRIDSWGTPCFIISEFDQKFWMLVDDFISAFCLLSDKIWTNLQLIIECDKNIILTEFRDLRSESFC
jgi:hypothetical protein